MSDETVSITPVQLEFLEVFWASKAPLDRPTLLKKINERRRAANNAELADSTVGVTLGKMRDRRLIEVFRPNPGGTPRLVPENQLSDALAKRDGKTTYGAAVQPDDVTAPKRRAVVRDAKLDELWQRHGDELLANLDEPLLGEPFALPNVYVPPLAYVIERDDDAPKGEHKRRQTRRVVALLPDMLEWAAQPEVEHAVRILSGDAGCGKSSFAKMFAKNLIERQHRVLLVPLHVLSVSVNPRAALASAAEKEGYPPDLLNPLGPTEPFVLILDGLDELAKQGEGGETAAMAFAKGVEQAVQNCMTNGRQIRVLLCGRPIAAQHASQSFQDPGQKFHLIPYLPPKDGEDAVTYTGQSLQKHDQRGAWWTNYAKYYNESKPDTPEPLQMPPVLREDRLKEFTAQPLLLLLLALAFRDRNKMDTAAQFQNQNLPPNPFHHDQLPERMADVFAWLVGRVYAREASSRKVYNRDGERSEYVSFVDFRDLLGVLGLAAWHTGGTRAATVEAVERLAEPLGLSSVLKSYCDTVKAGTLAIFVSFYTKHAGRLADTRESFEFTVKPFAEYLAAVGLVTALADCSARLGHPKGSGRRAEPWTAPELLFDLLQVTGPAIVTAEVYEHVCGEVSRRVQRGEEPDLAKAGRKTFTALLNAAVNDGLPAHKLAGLAFRDMSAQSDRAEHALLCLLGACVATEEIPLPPRYPEKRVGDWYEKWQEEVLAWETEHAVCIDWPSKTAAADFIRRVRKQQSEWWKRRDPLPLPCVRPSQALAARLRPVRGDPVRGDPVRGDPGRGDPGRGDPGRGDPGRGLDGVRLDTSEGRRLLRKKGALGVPAN